MLRAILSTLALLAPYGYFMGYAYREGWFNYFSVSASIFPKPPQEVITYGFFSSAMQLSEVGKIITTNYIIHIILLVIYVLILIALLNLRKIKICLKKSIRLKKTNSYIKKFMNALLDGYTFLPMTLIAPFIFTLFLLLSWQFSFRLGNEHASKALQKIISGEKIAPLATWDDEDQPTEGQVVFCDNANCLIKLDGPKLSIKRLDEVTITSTITTVN